MTDREFWMGPDFPRQPQEVLERLKTYGACVAADAVMLSRKTGKPENVNMIDKPALYA